MRPLKPEHITLSTYIDNLQIKGRYTFTRKEALEALAITKNAFKLALYRLIRKRRLIKPRKEFYVIVPLEYQNVGGPPPSWYIHDLMKFQKQPYYVGLLSAAALHGAAHQQPQQFQVITNKHLRPIIISRYSIKFFTKHNFENSGLMRIMVPTGIMEVSTPEMTALDLIRYVEAAGYLNNVATVLKELIEHINTEQLLWTAQAAMCGKDAKKEFFVAQRLGYLMDYCGGEEKTKLLAEWISKEKPAYVSLNPQNPFKPEQKNSKWRIYINEKIEADI